VNGVQKAACDEICFGVELAL